MSRVALITGATDGIGKATAARLLCDGWEVVVLGRSPERCERTLVELRRECLGCVVPAITADLAQTQQHSLTSDGFEANFAVGYLGRALLAWALEEVLRQTQSAQVLTVVGLNLQRIDLENPSTPLGFSSQRALGRGNGPCRCLRASGTHGVLAHP